MKRVLLVALITMAIITAVSAAWYASKLQHKSTLQPHLPGANIIEDGFANKKLGGIAAAAKRYADTHQYNTRVCFLIDMELASGKQRFFVYDLKADKVIRAGLVTHGCCNQNWLAGRKYGNAVGCGCTSPGKYKVGNPYQGRFGLAYKLYGLDASNSNAYGRFVVLHSMQCVPEAAVDPYPICQSDGCPAVSPVFLKELAALIDNSQQPVLLWIYE